jgi:hypothetical protein
MLFLIVTHLLPYFFLLSGILNNIFFVFGGREEFPNVQIITVLAVSVSIQLTVLLTGDEHGPAPCKKLLL